MSHAASKQREYVSVRAPQPVYPFTAIVGQEEMKLALLLNVIDPVIGGVLIMGHRGTGKSTAVRAIADLLPPIWKVRGCSYACDPASDENLCDACRVQISREGKLARQRGGVPVVDLPLGATEDRVCGSINIERALTSGIKAFEPGLLARANRGFLYIDEVNLLEDHLIDLLLDVAVTGRNSVEREGLSLEHPARFVLIGSGNPEEGELRPQLLDRFGLHAQVRTIQNLDERVTIVEWREEFERDPVGFCARREGEQQRLRQKLVRARKVVGEVKLSSDLLRDIARLCLQLGVDGHRGELTMARAARAVAALDGRRKVNKYDVRRVASLSLRHRLRRDPLEPAGDGSLLDSALDDLFPEPAPNGGAEDFEAPPDGAGGVNGRNTGQGGNGDGSQGSDFSRTRPAPVDAKLPVESLDEGSRLSSGARARNHSTRQQPTRQRAIYNNVRGRYARAVINKSAGSKIALDATLRMAIHNASTSTHQDTEIGSTRRLAINADSLRFKKFKRKAGTLFILALDTSGSMALNRIAWAKGAALWLLDKSYIRRDQVALVTCRGQHAEEILPPTRSAARARRLLDGLFVGGPTPLAAALMSSLEIARRAAGHGATRVVLLLFTDGRPNVALRNVEHQTAGVRQRAIASELQHLGRSLRQAGVTTVVVDTQSRFTSNGEGRRLAENLGGRYVALTSTTSRIGEQLAAQGVLD